MTEESLAKFKITESKQVAIGLKDLLNRFPTLSYRDVRDMVTWAFPETDNGHKLQTLKMLRESEVRGVKRPADIPDFEDGLRVFIPETFLMIGDQLTPLGSVGASVPFGGDPWSVYRPSLLVANFGEGRFGLISGPPGSGKTNLACVLIEELIAKNSRCTGNIEMADDVDGFTETYDMEHLAAFIAECVVAKASWTLFLDDTMSYWLRARATTRGNVTLDQFSAIVRHYRGNIVAISQREESISSTMESFMESASWFECWLPPGNVSIYLSGPNLSFYRTVSNFQQTSLPYNTHSRRGAFHPTMRIEAFEAEIETNITRLQAKVYA